MVPTRCLPRVSVSRRVTVHTEATAVATWSAYRCIARRGVPPRRRGGYGGH
jgi:hypothetical protein